MSEASARKQSVLVALTLLCACVPGALAQSPLFTPNNLVLSRSVYQGTPSTVTVGQTLPPNCVPGTVAVPLIASGTTNVTIKANSSSGCNKATNDGTYPAVFNNDKADGSFGITSPIFIDQISPSGALINTLAVDSSLIVTSFSSKSELALNLSTDGNSVTFGGYVGGPGYTTGANQLDVSNSNTPGVVDPSNPAVSQYYRAIGEIDANGDVTITDGNAYSGNNGRAAIKANPVGGPYYYQTGNDNNGGLSASQLTTTFVGVSLLNSNGVELAIPGQSPSTTPSKIGDFEITQVGYTTADKPGKDDNFRGLTIFNNTLYVTKGSGGNGINTVYQVGSAGSLPTPSNAPSGNLKNVPITILPGLPTTLASGTALNGTTGNPVAFPFGIWFADTTTLYVADEGDGTLVNPPVNGNIADAASRATAGLQKWNLNTATNTWSLAYVLNNGLNIGVPYSVANGPNGEVYPTALNPAAGGLRNITGRNNGDGTVTIWAVTSTLSTSGDQGADPNQLVMVTDALANTNPTVAATEQFTTLRSAGYGEVLRGISFTPGTAVPAVSSVSLASSLNPSTSGDLVALTAAVPNGATGTVTFNVDSGVFVIPAPVTNNVAVLDTSALTAGSHVITALYSGDSNYGPASSSPFTQFVVKASPSVGLASSVNPSTSGQLVAVTATVPVAATGTVTFNVDHGAMVLSDTVANGTAVLDSSALSAGTHSITATYNGDTNWQPASSTPLTQTVNKGTASVSVSSSVNPSLSGQLVALTASVSAGATGTITFNVDSGAIVVSDAVVNGSATLDTSGLSAGTHSIFASYGGDANWGSATSSTLTQTVNKGTPTITLSSSVNPSTSGQLVAITANVPAGTTGTITFSVDGGAIVASDTVVNGSATLDTSALSPGPHTITASYNGDSNWLAAVSDPFSQTVN